MCVRTPEKVLVCVCVEGRGVFEEMMHVLKILLRGIEMPGY